MKPLNRIKMTRCRAQMLHTCGFSHRLHSDCQMSLFLGAQRKDTHPLNNSSGPLVHCPKFGVEKMKITSLNLTYCTLIAARQTTFQRVICNRFSCVGCKAMGKEIATKCDTT
uniref:Uncharacterized protein n=1 Tax=Oryzias melastigma TaxID=30732 RepID=A0A3B3D505_ORYME